MAEPDEVRSLPISASPEGLDCIRGATRCTAQTNKPLGFSGLAAVVVPPRPSVRAKAERVVLSPGWVRAASSVPTPRGEPVQAVEPLPGGLPTSRATDVGDFMTNRWKIAFLVLVVWAVLASVWIAFISGEISDNQDRLDQIELVR
jgi:hypothetical protein